MSDKKLYLFKVTRRGYDPDEVLLCFQEMIRIFGERITKYDELVKQWGEETHRLKRQHGEDEECIRELTRQNRQLREENQMLRRAADAADGKKAASTSPSPATPGS